MKKLCLFFLSLLLPAISFAQIAPSTINPAVGNLNVQDSGTCSTAGSFLIQQLPLNAGVSSVTLTGTFSGTVTVRLSPNGTATWLAQSLTLASSGASSSFNVAGMTHICVDATTYSSGTIGVTIFSSTAPTGGSSTNTTSIPIIAGNAISVNAGETVLLNVSSNGSPPATTLQVRFHPLNGPTQTFTQASGALSCAGAGTQNMPECTPLPYITLPVAGLLEYAQGGFTTSPVAGGQAFAQIFLGCANLALTGQGTTTAANFGGCSPLPLTLQTGYPSGFQVISWPIPNTPAVSGAGHIFALNTSNPSAGSNVAITTPNTAVRIIILSNTFTFATGATGGNRFPCIQMGNGPGTVVEGQWCSSIPQPPNTTWTYTFSPGATSASPTVVAVSLPSGGIELSSSDPIQTGADHIAIVVVGIQGTDQISTIVTRVKTFEENN